MVAPKVEALEEIADNSGRQTNLGESHYRDSVVRRHNDFWTARGID